MSTKYAILGLLIERPRHGYELKQALSPAVARDGQLNDGVLYPLLGRLESEGLLRRRVDAKGSRARHVFHVTARGTRVFDAWLAGPDDEEDEVTYDFFVGHPFLTKSMFFARLPPATARAKLRAHAEAGRRKLAEFRRIRRGMRARGVDRWHLAILDFGIQQQHARLRWLDRLAGRRPDKE